MSSMPHGRAASGDHQRSPPGRQRGARGIEHATTTAYGFRKRGANSHGRGSWARPQAWDRQHSALLSLTAALAASLQRCRPRNQRDCPGSVRPRQRPLRPPRPASRTPWQGCIARRQLANKGPMIGHIDSVSASNRSPARTRTTFRAGATSSASRRAPYRTRVHNHCRNLARGDFPMS